MRLFKYSLVFLLFLVTKFCAQAQQTLCKGSISRIDCLYNMEVQNFSEKNDLNLIPLNQLVVNPDNLCSTLGGSMTTIKEAYNPTTNLGGYYREIWNLFEKRLGRNKYEYDWSHLEEKLRWCADRHTRLTMRLAQFSGYPYDSETLLMPDDYGSYKETYDIYFSKAGVLSDEKGQVVKSGKLIKVGYPQKYFWTMVKEGCPPVIVLQHEEDKCYEAFPNYNSEGFYKGWCELQKSLSKWLKGYLSNVDGTRYLINGRPVRRMNLIASMQAGFVGMYGEGWIKDCGVFPDDVNRCFDYAQVYSIFFPEIPLTYPLAVFYDHKYYGVDGLIKLWTINNKHGISGLYYDVIGEDQFHYYFDNSHVGQLLKSLEFDNRKIEGEGSGLYKSEDLCDLLNHAYGAHFSGVSLQNFAVTGERNTPTAQKNWSKFKTLVGAQLYLSNPNLTHKKGRQYCLSFQLQNLGLCRVFSPYWEPYVIFRDKQGKELKREKMKFDVKALLPNSQDFQQHSVLKDVVPIRQLIKLPPKVSTINFAIVDPYRVYENYWLHNYGRSSNGEYVVAICD